MILASHQYIASSQHANADTDNVMVLIEICIEGCILVIHETQEEKSHLDVLPFSFIYTKLLAFTSVHFIR